MNPDLLSIFAMNGHGPFVWGAFGIVLAAVAVELALLSSRRRALVQASQDEAEDASDEA
jgi:heme exporter protein CcmD